MSPNGGTKDFSGIPFRIVVAKRLSCNIQSGQMHQMCQAHHQDD